MSLKAQLQARVARCAPIETQHATFQETDATACATAAQQHPVKPHKCWVLDATDTATPPQQGGKEAATLAPSCALHLPSDATRNFSGWLATWQAKGWIWSEAEIHTFMARRDGFIQEGKTEEQAEALAERLQQRDRDGDDRVMCLECGKYQWGRCMVPVSAGIGSHLGELATRLQRCPVFERRAKP